MGNLLDNLSKFIFKDRQLRLIMIGMDNAGKSTILFKLKLGEYYSTTPADGLYVDNLIYKNITIVCWNCERQDIYRHSWKQLYRNTNAMIYVVDSSDRKRIKESVVILKTVLNEPELKNVVLLIVANKQDLAEAISVDELSVELDMSSLSDHKWHIWPVCAVSKEGLYEALDWFSNNINF